MARVFFLILPTQSHYSSCFPLATDLAKQGHEIYFAGTRMVQSHIPEPFKYVEFSYMSTYEVRTIKGCVGMLLQTMLGTQSKIKRYRDFISQIKQFENFVQKLGPGVIMIDEHLSHYLAYVEKFNIQSYTINTKLFSGKSKGIPPLNSSYQPKKNFMSHMVCEMIWYTHLVKKRWPRILTSIAFRGSSNDYFQKRFLKKSNSKIRFTDRSSMYDYDISPNTGSINLISRRLDFSWRKVSAKEIDLHYWNQSSQTLNPSLTDIIASNLSGKPIVYCGLGTMASRYSTAYLGFLANVIEAWRLSREYVLIISTGSSQLTASVKNTEKCVYIFDFVEQTALLPKCSLMITHGGLNSIKECIQHGVPMLGIANHYHQHTDTLGNISRIEHHKIGLQCKINDSPAVLHRKIKIILGNPVFGSSVKQMRSEIERSKKQVSISEMNTIEVS